MNPAFLYHYPEKRLFFQEGNDMYSTRIKTFYSRRIQDIDFGSRLNGKIGKTQFNEGPRYRINGVSKFHLLYTLANKTWQRHHFLVIVVRNQKGSHRVGEMAFFRAAKSRIKLIRILYCHQVLRQGLQSRRVLRTAGANGSAWMAFLSA